jgi:hypothetical protein
MMITLYLDMDGVIADFNKTYLKYDPKKEDRKRFRQSVMEYKIFEDLDLMPDAMLLLNHVKQVKTTMNVHVEILTSMGTHDPIQGKEAARQKQVWLNKHGITYKANFVRSKQEKANYATPTSILIDDSIGCITPFNAKGGHGILHTNAAHTSIILDTTILQINALNALRS